VAWPWIFATSGVRGAAMRDEGPAQRHRALKFVSGGPDDRRVGRSSAVRRRLWRALGYPVVVAGALSAIGGCSSGPPPARSAGSNVRVTERDFQIVASPTRVAAGDVVLSVKNRGPEQHEFIVARANGSALPLRVDGVTIDEDALEGTKVGGLEPGAPGSVRRLRLHLAPGRYELFCNMAGHYLGGMHTELVVS
jgi:uncharacterized cupredoxin-like copper-binding protein